MRGAFLWKNSEEFIGWERKGVTARISASPCEDVPSAIWSDPVSARFFFPFRRVSISVRKWATGISPGTSKLFHRSALIRDLRSARTSQSQDIKSRLRSGTSDRRFDCLPLRIGRSLSGIRCFYGFPWKRLAFPGVIHQYRAERSAGGFHARSVRVFRELLIIRERTREGERIPQR